MQNSVEDKVVLITGGGSGIGRATALLFAKAGAKLAIADIDAQSGQETAEFITSHGSEAIFMQTDVSQADQVLNMIEETVARYGRIDCAFNNAGIEGETKRTMDVTEDDFDRIIAVNLKGVWLCMKYELEQMVRQGHGSIVNTASVAGLVGAHSLPVYAASKHGVVGLTRSAAVEYARKGIRVNAVCPAVIRTPMVERAMDAFPKLKEAMVGNNPSKRLGEADEVAEAVLWLCSDASSFTNGATLTVDGGLTAQ